MDPLGWDPDRDGPGVLKPLSTLVRAIEAASAEEFALFVVALARAARKEEPTP